LTELKVLEQSRRRCALCFFFDGDLSEKRGQIAHLDDDRGNSTEDNLAFLCLDHHSVYDTTTSQHKGYTIDEAKKARQELYAAIRQDRHFSGSASTGSTPLKEADRQTFQQFLAVLPSGGSVSFIRTFNFGGGYRLKSLDDLKRFQHECDGPEHEFLDAGLEALRADLKAKVATFWDLLSAYSRQIGEPTNQTYKVPQRHEMCDPSKWQEIVNSINDAAENVVSAYDTFVRTFRERLA
jgi:hypothetical protein